MQAARILNYRFPFQLAPVAGTLCEPNWKRISISMFLLQSSGYSHKHGCWDAWCGFLNSPTSQNGIKRQVGEATCWPSTLPVFQETLELSRHKLVMMGKLSIRITWTTKREELSASCFPLIPTGSGKKTYFLITDIHWRQCSVYYFIFYFFDIEPNGLEGEKIQLISILALFKPTQ